MELLWNNCWICVNFLNLLTDIVTKEMVQDYFYRDLKYAICLILQNYSAMHKVDCWKYWVFEDPAVEKYYLKFC